MQALLMAIRFPANGPYDRIRFDRSPLFVSLPDADVCPSAAPTMTLTPHRLDSWREQPTVRLTQPRPESPQVERQLHVFPHAVEQWHSDNDIGDGRRSNRYG